jgi:type IV secretory pathway component VirB8
MDDSTKSYSVLKAAQAEMETRQLLLALNKRLIGVCLALTAALLFLALGYIFLLPLKEVQPYIVEVDKLTGEARSPAQQSAVKFEPGQDSILFFVSRCIKAQFSIHPQLAKDNEALALSCLRGDIAINKHKAFREQDQTFARLATEPTLVRDVSIDSITPIAGAQKAVVANITTTTTSRSGTKVEKTLITSFYEMIPPKTAKDRETHPLGLYIVDFSFGATSNSSAK